MRIVNMQCSPLELEGICNSNFEFVKIKHSNLKRMVILRSKVKTKSDSKGFLAYNLSSLQNSMRQQDCVVICAFELSQRRKKNLPIINIYYISSEIDLGVRNISGKILKN